MHIKGIIAVHLVQSAKKPGKAVIRLYMVRSKIKTLFAKETRTGLMPCRVVADMVAGFYKCMGPASSCTKNKNIHFQSLIIGIIV
jgi:hypothetical protein